MDLDHFVAYLLLEHHLGAMVNFCEVKSGLVQESLDVFKLRVVFVFVFNFSIKRLSQLLGCLLNQIV